MLVLFSVAFYVEELDFYISNQDDMARGFSVLAFFYQGETEMYKDSDTIDAGQVMKGESQGGGEDREKKMLDWVPKETKAESDTERSSWKSKWEWDS